MLMFAKLSLHSFVYDMVNVFCFPDKTIQEIYNRYQIQKCFLYENLTDTNSTSLFFLILFVMSIVLLQKVKQEKLFLNV